MSRPIQWPPAARSRVCELWVAGAGGPAIAETIHREFGLAVSKSSVIGVAFRAGLAFQGTRCGMPPVRAPKPRRKAMSEEERLRRDRERAARKRERDRAELATPARPVATRPEPASVPGLPTSLRIPLTDTREDECRYIADDPVRDGPATCCGHPAALGSPWCAPHRELCTTRSRSHVTAWAPSRRAA